MSDFSLPDDEILSSYLDGELTAEESARLATRLESDTELAARLNTLRTAAEIIATPVPHLPTGDRDRMLSAALGASTTSDREANGVIDLGAARSRRQQWQLRLATVAAAAVALAIAVPAIRAIDSGSDSDSAGDSATAELSVEAETGGDSADGDDSADVFDAMQAPADVDEPAEAEMADAEMAEDDTVDEGFSGADGSATTSTSIHGPLDGPNPEFDPLEENLGDFTGRDDLNTAAASQWSAYSLDRASDDEGAPSDDITPTEIVESAVASQYLDQFGGCGAALNVFIEFDFAAPVAAVDYSVATVGSDTFTVALFLLEDGSGVLQTIDTADCTPGDPVVLPAG